MKRFATIVLSTILLLISSSSAFAGHRQVLGLQDQDVNIGPTVDGPGILLPDSPFYFIDGLKQNIRIAFAITPEAKAKVYSSIAGERMAELRFMITKKNLLGVRTDLEGIADNFNSASEQVELAKMSGRNVTILAKEVNDQIKAKQSILDELYKQSQGELESSTKAVLDSLTISKAKVENSLNPIDLKNEINDDILRDAEIQTHEASDSAEELKNTLSDLKDEVSTSAKNSQKNREEALKKIILEKNEALIKAEERKIEVEKQQAQQLLQMHSEAVTSAKEMVEQALEVSNKFEKLKTTASN